MYLRLIVPKMYIDAFLRPIHQTGMEPVYNSTHTEYMDLEHNQVWSAQSQSLWHFFRRNLYRNQPKIIDKNPQLPQAAIANSVA